MTSNSQGPQFGIWTLFGQGVFDLNYIRSILGTEYSTEKDVSRLVLETGRWKTLRGECLHKGTKEFSTEELGVYPVSLGFLGQGVSW